MSISIKENSCIFTVCSICYLPKALVLAESVYKIEGKKVIIYLADRKSNIVKTYKFADIRWIEEENIPDLEHLAFIYDVTEFSTSIKPLLASRLLESHNAVIFLDPDICLYNSLNDLYKELEVSPIVLTPHYITPQSTLEEGYDQAMMRFGSFNMGFFAINNSDEAKNFLSWWNDRCINLCFFETQFGLSTDQKWVTIAPCFFPNIKILFEQEYNMAFWNLLERDLTTKNGVYWVNEKAPLIFFHFSSFNYKNPEYISTRPHKWNQTGREDLKEICINYSEALQRFDENYSTVNYGFDYFDNGNYISPTLRRAYVSVYEKLAIDNPFLDNARFNLFIKKNYLLEKKGHYKASGTESMNLHSKKFKITYFFMRRILQFLGPNQFSNFSRLLVYLSSYRQNKDLWKL
jgi:hypothetical protein